jgi:hypothetical protein
LSGPQTENKAAAVIAGILKNLIEGAAEDLALVAFMADVPWMPKPIAEFIVGTFGKYFYKGAAEVSTKIIITIQAQTENVTVKACSKKLDEALASGDKDAIERASVNLEYAWSSLIHWDGSFHP